MINWELYRTRLGLGSSDATRDLVIQRERETILRKSSSSPALESVSVNGTAVQMFINSSRKPTEKKISMLPGDSIDLGDIIAWDNTHWMVTQVDYDDKIYRSGIITLCNSQLRWQNPSTYQVINRWCVIAREGTSDIKDGKIISSSQREFRVMLPFDDETRLLDLDKRFMLEVINGKPRTYKCTMVDQQTKRYQGLDGGVVELVLTQDEAGQADDRVDLMICNYKEPPEVAPPTTGFRSEISGRGIIRVGIARKYYATFYDENESVLDNMLPVWDIEVPEGFEPFITQVQGSDYIELTVTSDSAIGHTIVLKLADADGLSSPDKMTVEVVATHG